MTKWNANGERMWSVGRHDARTNTRNAFTRKPAGWLHHPYNITGVVRGNVVLNDWMETPGMVWSRDGLYAGHMLEGRVDDGLPDAVYRWWFDPEESRDSDTYGISLINRDSAHSGTVFERPNGDIIWLAPGSNGAVMYRIHGWDNWTTRDVPLHLDTEQPSAEAAGTGLTGRYYEAPGTTTEGEGPGDGVFMEPPVETSHDPQVWYGVGWRKGGDKVIDGTPRPPVVWKPRNADGSGAAWDYARWSGELEIPLTESYRFTTYARGSVRLFIDGRQVIFGWNDTRKKLTSEPIELKAGQRVPIRIDFHSNVKLPALSLCWESRSLDRVRIPAAYLYPQAVDASTVAVPGGPHPRAATQRIAAETFDVASPGVRWDGFVWETHVREYIEGLDQPGDFLGYRAIDFGTGIDSVAAKLLGQGTIEVRLGAPDGDVVAVLSADGESNAPVTAGVQKTVTGIHDVYLVKTGGGHLRLRWFTCDGEADDR